MGESNQAAVFSALRTLASALGGVLVAHGVINEALFAQVFGALTVLAPLAWGMWDKFRTESRTQTRIDVAVNDALDSTQSIRIAKGPQ